MSRYFGTNGVRGVFTELTPELALRLSQAFGLWSGKEKILVARDMRLTGECLLSAVKSGLASVGCEVLDLGLCSAPGAELMLKKERGNGLIIVTASHNPPDWNALKFVDKNGITVSRERGEEIEKLMEKAALAKWDEVKPMRKVPYSAEQHAEAIEKTVDLNKIRKANLRLALDFGNGTSALYSDMFKKLAKVTAINSDIDGKFPGRPSEPSEPNVQNLVNLVKQGGYDAGFAWDGDADRFIAIDEKGNFIVGDKIFALSVLLKLRKEGGKSIATTVATSRAAEDIAKKYGAKTVYTQVGAPYLSEAMAKQDVAIAGEEVGGVIWRELSFAKDGPATAVKLMELMAEKPLSSWIAELPQYYNAKTKIHFSKEKKLEIIEKLSKTSKGKVNKLDGIRIDFEDSWVIVRASGTEDYIRIFAEARTKEKAEKLVKEYEKTVLAL
ncbi:MAG: phosphoglucosamine mutase [Candidatus ainarchaeum sp.]|nr:phosphoglucosamine mutase [Candidatus ainarchaeum sp.]